MEALPFAADFSILFLKIKGYLVIGAGLGLVALLAAHFSSKARVMRKLDRAPSTPIERAVEGQQIKVTGRLRFAGPPLKAPISGRLCAFYEVTIKERRQNITRSTYAPYHHWVEVAREREQRDFILRDDTGEILVEVSGAKVVVGQDAHQTSGKFNDATPELEALLDRNHHASTDMFGDNVELRYHEGIFEEDEVITVLGKVARVTGPDGSARLALRAPNGLPIYITDLARVAL